MSSKNQSCTLELPWKKPSLSKNFHLVNQLTILKCVEEFFELPIILTELRSMCLQAQSLSSAIQVQYLGCYKWEWNIFPFDFMCSGENSFNHSLKILGQKRCFLGPKSHILNCSAFISFVINWLILGCSLLWNSRVEIIPACVHSKSN